MENASAGTSDDLPELDAAEQRVLGCLLEKEVTVPASYPMTVNAVRTACNQASSREPVVDYDEDLVQRTLVSLRGAELVVMSWQGRTVKYAQTFAQRRGLGPDERAVLTVLLLRGPQPAGALRSRTERLHSFGDRGEVESCLARMAAAEPALVRELPRRPGQQDTRWIHLLGPVGEADDAHVSPAVSAVDREVVLADGADARDDKVRATYASIADAYAETFSGELADLPFESWLLTRVAASADGAPVVEVGTGPGHVAAFLARAGADAMGLDLVPEMVEQARLRHPDVTYEVGDLRRLMRPVAEDGWGAVVAWYSLIHLAPSELVAAVAALTRPLRSGGWLVIALHTGVGLRGVSQWLGREVDVDIVLHGRDEVLAAVAGFVDVEWYQRGPITSRNETSERLYVLARKA